MSSWQDLIQVAMLGTDRQPLPHLAEDDPAAVLTPQADESKEKQLLDQIAIHAYRRRAAAMPSIRLGNLPEAAPADDLPTCSPEAARTLNSFMNGSRTWLIKEWLQRAQMVGVRPADAKLPELLDMGRRMKSVRHLVYDTIGSRGRWLATQKPEWQYATLDLNDPNSFQSLMASGKILEQQFALERMRAVDPNLAREHIEALWPTATARFQTLMLDLMIPHASMADEPFLESLLDKGVIAVRRRAVDVLSRIPESRLCARMGERAAAYLKWVAGRRRKSAFIELEMPANLNEDLRRDGLMGSKGRDGMTQLGWRLLHFVRATPLSTWTELFPYPIEEIIAAGVASEWDKPLIRGWSVAAQRQDNKVWANALMFGCDGIIEGRYAVSSLLGTLEPEQREQFVLGMLERPSRIAEFQRNNVESTILRECKHQWSESFGRELRRHYINHIRADHANKQPQLVLHRTMRQMANYFPPALLEESRAELEPLGATYKRWQSSIIGFLRILQTRAEMHRSLGE